MITPARTPIFILLLAIDLLMFIDFPAYMRSNNYPLSNIPYDTNVLYQICYPTANTSILSYLLFYFDGGNTSRFRYPSMDLSKGSVFSTSAFVISKYSSITSFPPPGFALWRVESGEWSVSNGGRAGFTFPWVRGYQPRSIKINQEQPRAIK